MNEDDLRSIRDNLALAEEREREKHHELRQTFRTFGDLDASLNVAWKAAIAGGVPSAALIVAIAYHRAQQNLIEGIATAIIWITFLSMVVFMIPVPCGTFAHLWFRNSMIPTRIMSIALVLLADTAVSALSPLLISAFIVVSSRLGTSFIHA